MFILFGVLSFTGLPAAAAPVKLRVTIQLPADSALHESIAAFKDTVETETQGAIAVEIFPSAKLYKPHEVADAVGSGAIEMGAALLSQYIETVPASDIFDLPFMFTSDTLLRAATLPDSKVRGPIDAAILAETGARVLWWFSSGPIIMLSKDEPNLTPASIANRKR